VVNDEGLRSYKAIAFIRIDPKSISIKPKKYVNLDVTLQRILSEYKPLDTSLKGEKYYG
jgi:hypothetical protein